MKHKSVTAISVNDIEQVLLPLWHTPTGPYVRSFLERVFDHAMVKGYLPRGLNPAAFKGNLEHVLPRVRRVTEHHASLDWSEVPAQYATLTGHGADALRFTILTASRQREVREMRWGELDFVTGTSWCNWTIPAERYKTRKAHLVPLSPAALALLPPQGAPEALVWGRIGSHAFSTLLNGACDPHGFRTSFAVWCVEAGGFADDLAQRCLGHVVGTQVTRAYQRSDFIQPRRHCLEAWAEFVSGTN